MSDRPRPATVADLEAVAEVHLAAFPESFLTRLGHTFLRWYYAEVLRTPTGILLLDVEDGLVTGFVAGFARPSSFHRSLAMRAWRVAPSLAFAMARRPDVVGRALSNVVRIGRLAGGDQPHDGATSELASLAVRPSHAGRGIGSRLVVAFSTTAARSGSTAVELTTDAASNQRTLDFYRRHGFEVVRTIERGRGRPMVLCRRDLGARAPRPAGDSAPLTSAR
jgi:ribosomal protein S18 acetylase RimI-like enzyme